MKTNKITLPLVVAATSLAFVLSPTLGLANTPAKKAHQPQVVWQTARQSGYFHMPAAETENHGRSIEQVIEDQRDWYQMR